MKLLLVTDAWYPQVNGVVRTLTHMRDGLIKRGWQVEVLGPTGFTISCPTYPEIRLTIEPSAAVYEMLKSGSTPDAIHIATEGPLGRAMRTHCMRMNWPFTTSFHTRFPEYLKARFALPRRWTYRYLRYFHESSKRVLAPTKSIVEELKSRSFQSVELWSRGVDVELFHPDKRRAMTYSGPVQLYVGRIAVEKNLEAFLELDTPGTKVLVGDGPDRKRLERQFPNAKFVGAKFGEELAAYYASADVFVFPSHTDTFGLVLLEALASGLPVAAFPIEGPKDVVTDPRAGVLNSNLKDAILQALTLKREDCRAFALNWSWEKSINTFESALEPIVDNSGGFIPRNLFSNFGHSAAEDLYW